MRRVLGSGHFVNGSGGAAAYRIGGVAVFLAIAFGLAWAVWMLGLWVTGLSGAALLGTSGQAVVLPGAFAPAVAAIAVRKWVTREGFADAGLGPNLRRGWRYYLVALLWPFVAASLVVLLAVASGIGDPDFSFAGETAALSPQETVEADAAPGSLMVVVVGLLFSSVLSVPLLWGEEFGWRGYLQRRFFPRRPLLAALSTGLVWGVWHYPLVFAGYGTFSEERTAGFVVYPLLGVLFAVFFGWLMERGGSVWIPSLAHSAHNTAFGGLLLLLFAGDSGFATAAIWLVLVPYAALCSWIVLTGKLKSGQRRPRVGT